MKTACRSIVIFHFPVSKPLCAKRLKKPRRSMIIKSRIWPPLFEAAVAECLSTQTRRAMQIFRHDLSSAAQLNLVVAGGVAANQYLRQALRDVAEAENFALFVPPVALCTDNAASI